MPKVMVPADKEAVLLSVLWVAPTIVSPKAQNSVVKRRLVVVIEKGN